jgi:predicted DNA-binding transcriptional regulator AlpA
LFSEENKLMQTLIRPKEAQRRLGVSRSCFYERFVNTGRLRPVRISGRAVAIVSTDLDRLIEELIAERDETPLEPRAQRRPRRGTP